MSASQVIVSGINMELGEALVIHVEKHMGILSQKYFGYLVTCRVAFRKQSKSHSFECHIQVIVGRDMHYASAAEFDEVYGCFKQAYAHLAKQLRRQKRARHEDKPNSNQKEQMLNDCLRVEPEIDE